MNMEFKSSGCKWKLLNDCIYYSNLTKKKIDLKDIIQVDYMEGMGFVDGEIIIKLKGKHLPIRLKFGRKQERDAEIAKKYIEEHASNELRQKNKEYKKKCNVCGQIICYTETDLKRNKENRTLAGLYSFQSLTSSSSYHKYEKAKRADSVASHIVDYTRCPHCHSVDLTEITENMGSCDGEKASNKNFDELKKYKELYDEGIITKEEFEAKKKQLLGL